MTCLLCLETAQTYMREYDGSLCPTHAVQLLKGRIATAAQLRRGPKTVLEEQKAALAKVEREAWAILKSRGITRESFAAVAGKRRKRWHGRSPHGKPCGCWECYGSVA